jgi:pyrroline-5-carboxylate reductase
MTSKTIGFVGAGNMARSLAGGLIDTGYDPKRILASDPTAEVRDAVAERLGIQCLADNGELANQADLVVLAVKPQQLQAVARELAPAIQARQPLVVSIAAGIRAADVERWLGGGVAIVRAMPNTPALVGSGATGLYANPLVTDAQRNEAETVLRAVGVTVWLGDEAQLDVVTALSGSGPAYFLMIMEALEQAAVTRGLDPATARLLILETAFGTAKLALESDEDPGELRRRVTSPGGTTERALDVLEKGGLGALLGDALEAAAARSRELADILGRD